MTATPAVVEVDFAVGKVADLSVPLRVRSPTLPAFTPAFATDSSSTCDPEDRG